MGLESRAVSAPVTKHFVTIFIKHVITQFFKISSPQPIGSIEPHRGQVDQKLVWRHHGNIDIEKCLNRSVQIFKMATDVVMMKYLLNHMY